MFEELPRYIRRSAIRALERSTRYRAISLATYPNVHNIGYGQKTRAGNPTRQTSLIVFVDKKERKPKRPIPKLIPIIVHGRRIHVPTDVKVAPSIGMLCGYEAGDVIYGGRPGQPSYPGSCGYTWAAPNGTSYIVTCAHLFFNPNSPLYADYCQSIGLISIGEIVPWTGLSISSTNNGDAALVNLYNGVPADTGFIRNFPLRISKIGDMDGANVRYIYSASGGNIIECRSPAKIVTTWRLVHRKRWEMKYKDFWTVDLPPGQAIEGGHSGSLLVRPYGNSAIAVGIVFGMSGPRQAMVYSAGAMFRRLGIPV